MNRHCKSRPYILYSRMRRIQANRGRSESLRLALLLRPLVFEDLEHASCEPLDILPFLLGALQDSRPAASGRTSSPASTASATTIVAPSATAAPVRSRFPFSFAFSFDFGQDEPRREPPSRIWSVVSW